MKKTKTDDTLELKRHIEDYLVQRGLPLNRNFRCLNPAHEDKHPSMSYNREAMNVHCFSCGATYDLIDLIGLEYGISDPAQKFEMAREIYGRPSTKITQVTQHTQFTQLTQGTQFTQLPQQEYDEFYRAAHKDIGKTNYPAKRGLSQETIDKFNLGYVESWKHPKNPKAPASPRLIIPIDSTHYLARSTEETRREYTKLKVGQGAPLFNGGILKDITKPVFIVEGEIDAMSIEQVGGHAVGLGSISKVDMLLNTCDTVRPQCTFIIALDNEDAENVIKAAEKLKEGLEQRNIPYIVAPATTFGEHKDANEALIADAAELAKRVAEAEAEAITREEQEKADAEEAYKDNYAAGSFFLKFISRLQDGEYNEPIPTGYKNLDELLDGGLYPGLYILGAVPSLGKTAFLLQAADQIAQSGEHVLMVALEMSTDELIARSLSRITAELDTTTGHAYAETARRVLRGGKRYMFGSGYSQQENELYDDAIAKYAMYGNNIFYREGLGNVKPGDVREYVAEHIKATGRKPVLMVDYLQILQAQDPRSTDKQNTDYAVLELKRISRDYNIPVIAVTSFNRQGYNEKVNMAQAKESGAIEYGCDVMLGMQVRDYNGEGAEAIDEEKKQNERQVELVILKNRNGRTGAKAYYGYLAKFNLFKENGNEL